MIRKFLARLTGGTKRETKPKDFEWEQFQASARKQFKRLKDKGLSIPVVTI
jgi:hypothetical protein